MRAAKGVESLADKLTQAASQPLVAPPVPFAQQPPAKSRKMGSVSVFLRLPPDLHNRLEIEATNRTKATGKGVTVQQVILDKLAGQI